MHTPFGSILEALSVTRHAARSEFQAEDPSEIDDLVTAIELELQTERPNRGALTTYLNSLSRRLRREPKAQRVWLKLDDAMQKAAIPLH